MYQVTQHNGDTGEIFTAMGETIYQALAEVVKTGQAATQHRATDKEWLAGLAVVLAHRAEVERGFARYTAHTVDEKMGPKSTTSPAGW